ncbi:DoxX family protein [Kribbella sandramycini]|uniref:DoxX family protein n=1 Tax=Kribbella sandramycini TaxID=60450 RepID=A0A7Y4KWC7_9ACTN|nr:DoxX family protein [Kribbella sandramycini]MBB6567501.1 putative membrane protein YphA (DoxX/SURF4 family) [Kribbella sandramycini]NOL39892.1 DoxX family protein [Kribbella sandramycini]
MNVFLWILAGVLAAFFLAAGLGKVGRPYDKVRANPNMKWVEDFSPGQLKLLGTAELLGALGLILPAALDIAPILTPLAASGLAVIMIGAIVTHARRKENQPIVLNAIVLVVALVVAIFRFGPNSF